LDITSNPGPTITHDLNAGNDQNSNRSLSNKELQMLASNIDIIAVTETWLKPDILNCELLPGNDFAIHRQDRVDRSWGGVMLAVRTPCLASEGKILRAKMRKL
jgi:hypothetical protein